MELLPGEMLRFLDLRCRGHLFDVLIKNTLCNFIQIAGNCFHFCLCVTTTANTEYRGSQVNVVFR